MKAQERNPANAGTANTPQIQKTLFVLRYNPPFSFVLYYGTGPELSTSDHLVPKPLLSVVRWKQRTQATGSGGCSRGCRG